MVLVPYFFLGAVFGAVIMEAEVISWFRIQEMFRFQGAHMYLVMAAAVVVAGVSLLGIRRAGLKTAAGAPMGLPPKVLGSGVRYLAGGTIFGLGWALTGACPGPLVALIAGGVPVMIAALASAIAGTWVYGYLRPRLPH
jgi:uncharacterized membrane protein YedE/YeeE